MEKVIKKTAASKAADFRLSKKTENENVQYSAFDIQIITEAKTTRTLIIAQNENAINSICQKLASRKIKKLTVFNPVDMKISKCRFTNIPDKGYFYFNNRLYKKTSYFGECVDLFTNDIHSVYYEAFVTPLFFHFIFY